MWNVCPPTTRRRVHTQRYKPRAGARTHTHTSRAPTDGHNTTRSVPNHPSITKTAASCGCWWLARFGEAEQKKHNQRRLFVKPLLRAIALVPPRGTKLCWEKKREKTASELCPVKERIDRCTLTHTGRGEVYYRRREQA